MDRLIPTPSPPSPASLGKLLKMAFDGCDLQPLRWQMLARRQSNPSDTAALLNLCVIEQVLGDQAEGLSCQAEALSIHRLYQSSWPASPQALRVLAFMAPGDLGANTPIDLLLQNSDVVLYSLYVVPGQPLPDPLPDHDVAIVIVGESDRIRPVLQEIERLIPTWPCPVLNLPARVLRLSREEMFRTLRDAPGVVMPSTVRIRRQEFEQLGHGLPPGNFLDDTDFPLIVRTIGSHAGRDLAKLDQAPEITAYLTGHPDAEFFLSPFVDYRSPDGLFRKYRIIWVDGRPFPVHMAIAGEWKLWYLNANMDSSAAKRAEEERFMSNFEAGFALRHAEALSVIAQRLGLEYMGVDCAETPDGNLLVFEGDIALVAHDMDPPDLYPYKGPRMRELFAAFEALLRRRSAPGSARPKAGSA